LKWRVRHGDILDVPADVLVCSANVYLTLSGGVGGAFRLRYGDEMQERLSAHLQSMGRRHVERGDLIALPGGGSPYRSVLHAVAVDGLYESSPEIVADLIDRALLQAAGLLAKSVALPALATGYGKLSIAGFREAVLRAQGQHHPPIESVTICVRSMGDYEELLGLEQE
jgi:O-acetyl-ADP-ribose deacetylase (regulator of RNase III)